MDAGSGPQLAGRRVLVVEDEALIAALACDMLDELGAIATGPAATVEHALRVAATEPLDAAIVDRRLGVERSDAVIADLIARNVPVVIATGYSDAAFASGDTTLLQKPYALEDLSRALTAALLRGSACA